MRLKCTSHYISGSDRCYVIIVMWRAFYKLAFSPEFCCCEVFWTV